MTNKQLEATAYHEAGHAVLEVYLGGKLRNVSIVPLEGSHGRVTRFLSRTLDTPEWNDNFAALGRRLPRLIILLAGDIAQRMYRRSSFRLWHPRHDFEAVADYALKLCGGNSDEANALIKWLCVHTEKNVKSLWPVIDKFAGKLLEQSEINGADATQLMAESAEASLIGCWRSGDD